MHFQPDYSIRKDVAEGTETVEKIEIHKASAPANAGARLSRGPGATLEGQGSRFRPLLL